MSAALRDEFAPQPLDGSAHLPAAEAPRVLEPPWPNIGDDWFPVSEDSMQSLAAEVPRLAKRWRQRIGSSELARPAQNIEQVAHVLCSERWGPGRCEQRLPDEERETLLKIKARLRLWLQAHKQQKARFDAEWSPLHLYYVGPHHAVGRDGEETSGFVLLLIFSEKKALRLLFYGDRLTKPMAGHIVEFRDLRFECVMDENQVARFRS